MGLRCVGFYFYFKNSVILSLDVISYTPFLRVYFDLNRHFILVS